jgi:actin-related protein
MDQTLIIDNGSGYIKSGLISENSPSLSLPTLIGKPKYLNTIFYQDDFKKFRKNKKNRTFRQKQFHVFGKEASESLGLYNLSQPILRGDILSIDDLEKFYEYLCFDKLKMNVSEMSLMISEKLNANNSTRKGLVEMIFEKMRVGVIVGDNINLRSYILYIKYYIPNKKTKKRPKN